MAIEHFNISIQKSAWKSTAEIEVKEGQINYTTEIREKLKEKRRLQKI